MLVDGDRHAGAMSMASATVPSGSEQWQRLGVFDTDRRHFGASTVVAGGE